VDRPLTLQPLVTSGAQIGTQNLLDPELARVVAGWPDLSRALKAAILVIVDSR
jgi:hypothetical protein